MAGGSPSSSTFSHLCPLQQLICCCRNPQYAQTIKVAKGSGDPAGITLQEAWAGYPGPFPGLLMSF